MKQFMKSFFSTSNEINENTVMGVLFSGLLIVTTFLPVVAQDKYYVLAGIVAAFFGLGALKK
jgi:membrane protein CcdC involved in cytochrome C biogenesis